MFYRLLTMNKVV